MNNIVKIENKIYTIRDKQVMFDEEFFHSPFSCECLLKLHRLKHILSQNHGNELSIKGINQ